MKTMLRSLCVCVGAVLLAGCASLPATTDAPSFQRRYGEFVYCALDAVRQTSEYNCGPACLEAVTQYWKIPVLQSDLSEEHPAANPVGYSLAELKSAALRAGLKAYVLAMRDAPQTQLEEQIGKGRPVICAVRQPQRAIFLRRVPLIGRGANRSLSRLGPKTDHFVLVIGYDADRVLVMDPAYGFEALRWDVFERRWSKMGYAALVVSG